MHSAPTTDSRFAEHTPTSASESEFLWKVYRWMSIGLALTGAIAWFVASTRPWSKQERTHEKPR